MNAKRLFLFWLIPVLAIAVFLRLKGLTFQSLWLDELFTLSHTGPSQSFSRMIHSCQYTENNPPLFYLIFWIGQRVWGVGEYSARLLPALFGILGVGSMYVLGKEMFSRRTGLFAAAVTALSPFHILYSQEVRAYSLLFLMTALSYFYLVRLLVKLDKKNAVLYFVFTSLMIYTHYFGLFVLAAQLFFLVVWFLTQKDLDRGLFLKRFLLAFFLVVLIYLPWATSLARQVGIEKFWIKQPGPGFFSGFFKQYFGDEPYLTLVFTFLIIVFLSGRSKKGRFPENKLLLSSWIFVVLFIPYLRSFNHPPCLIPRYSMAIVPAIILMVSEGLEKLRDVRFRYFLFGTVIVMLLVNIFFTRGNYYKKLRKEQWREAAEFIVRHDPSGKYPVYGHGLFEYYFNGIFKRNRRMKPRIANLEEAKKACREIIDGAIPGFWLLEGHYFAAEGVYEFLERNLETTDWIELVGARAALYRPFSPEPKIKPEAGQGAGGDDLEREGMTR